MCWCAVKKLLTHSCITAENHHFLGDCPQTLYWAFTTWPHWTTFIPLNLLRTFHSQFLDPPLIPYMGSFQFMHYTSGGIRIQQTWLNYMISWGKPEMNQLECGPMPNVMATLPTTGGALCWRPQFGWCPLLACRAVMLPRRKTRWNLQGCPKLANRSQPLVSRSSPYYEDMCRSYRYLTSFFRLSIHALAAKIQPDKVVR